MEQKNTAIIFNGKEEAAPQDFACGIALPGAWVARMGLNPERCEAALAFDGDIITIQRPMQSGIKRAPLASKSKIRRFSLIWVQMYQNHAAIPFCYFEDMEYVAEGLADLGFEMDCGKAYCEKFCESALPNLDELKHFLPEMDLQTLGNLIFSQWRYWNHWSEAKMEEQDYEWFVFAFSRLAELAR